MTSTLFFRTEGSPPTGAQRPPGVSKRVCCGLHEGENTCYNPCSARTCEHLVNPPEVCPLYCALNQCDCLPNYYLNGCGVCVTEEQCSIPCTNTPIQCPGPNEELVGCLDPTKARICRDARPSEEPSCSRNSPFPLQLNRKARWRNADKKGLCILNQCECKVGFSRNKCGICVEDEKCDQPCRPGRCQRCSDPNEIRYKRLRKCEFRTCKSLKKASECSANGDDKVYHNQCDCKEGFVRNNCGKCVYIDECEDTPPCECSDPCSSELEDWRCVNVCTERTCDNVIAPKQCLTPFCSYKCDCIEGLYRNENGQCVPRAQCSGSSSSS